MTHEKEVKPGRSYKDNIIARMQADGIEIPKVKVAEGLGSHAANAIEIALIAAIGRYPAGPLANRTRGGDGLVDPSEEVRRKMSICNLGKKRGPRTDAVKAKISAAHTGRKTGRQPDEVQARRSASLVKAWAKPEADARRLTGGMNGRKHSLATITKIREGNLGKVRTPEQRATISASIRGRKASEVTRAKMAEVQKGRMHSEATRTKISLTKRRKFAELNASLDQGTLPLE